MSGFGQNHVNTTRPADSTQGQLIILIQSEYGLFRLIFESSKLKINTLRGLGQNHVNTTRPVDNPQSMTIMITLAILITLLITFLCGWTWRVPPIISGLKH